MKRKFDLKTLISLALLAALCAVLKAFASVPLSFMGFKTAELSLAPLPVMVAGVFFGPLAGGLAGFAGEMAGFFLGIQMGGYDPVFSAVMALYGIIAGLFYLGKREDAVLRIIGLTALGVICTAFIKTVYLTGVYGLPAGVIIPNQAAVSGVALPVYMLLMTALIKSLRPVVNRRFLSEQK